MVEHSAMDGHASQACLTLVFIYKEWTVLFGHALKLIGLLFSCIACHVSCINVSVHGYLTTVSILLHKCLSNVYRRGLRQVALELQY